MALAAVVSGTALLGALGVVALTVGPEVTCTTSDQVLDGDLAAGAAATRCVRLEAGQAARFRVAPTDGQDVVLAVAVGADVTDDDFFVRDGRPVPFDDVTDDVFSGGLAGAAADDLGTVVLVADERAAGEPEAVSVPPLPMDVELTVVVAGFDGAPGGFTLDLELLDPPPDFDPRRYPDLGTFEAEFLGTPAYEAHYGPFFEGDFYP